MKRQPKEPVKKTSIWACDACPSAVSMTFEQLLEHAKTVHNLDLKGKKASRKMVMHLDCADSYHSTWEVECEGLKLTNSTSNPRHADDPMREPG